MTFFRRNGRPRKKNKSKKIRPPWILRVPSIFQINSSLIFIAFVVFAIGIAAATGLSNPQTITSQMNAYTYPIYGGGLALASVALIYGIITRDFLIEKFSARIMSMGIGTFAIWALVAAGVQRSIVTMGFCAIIVFLLEQRISLINCLLQAKVITYTFEENLYLDHRSVDGDYHTSDRGDRDGL